MRVQTDSVIMTEREYQILTTLAELGRWGLPGDSERKRALDNALQRGATRVEDGWLVSLRDAAILDLNMHDMMGDGITPLEIGFT